MEAESVQERSDHKTLHCLIYERQQGSRVWCLPFSLPTTSAAQRTIETGFVENRRKLEHSGHSCKLAAQNS